MIHWILGRKRDKSTQCLDKFSKITQTLNYVLNLQSMIMLSNVLLLYWLEDLMSTFSKCVVCYEYDCRRIVVEFSSTTGNYRIDGTDGTFELGKKWF